LISARLLVTDNLQAAAELAAIMGAKQEAQLSLTNRALHGL